MSRDTKKPDVQTIILSVFCPQSSSNHSNLLTWQNKFDKQRPPAPSWCSTRQRENPSRPITIRRKGWAKFWPCRDKRPKVVKGDNLENGFVSERVTGSAWGEYGLYWSGHTRNLSVLCLCVLDVLTYAVDVLTYVADILVYVADVLTHVAVVCFCKSIVSGCFMVHIDFLSSLVEQSRIH